MTNLIETHELAYAYRQKPVIRQLSLQVPEHSIYGFLGPNGSGKTTTIKLLLGLLRPQQGAISIFGKDLATHTFDILNRTGSLVETPTVYLHLTAWDNLEYLRILFKRSKDRIEEVLHLVGLAEAKYQKVKHFSLGMKQRLGIAFALFNDPQLLIVDEPVNGLDPSGIQEMRLLFRTLQQAGKTIFVSSHLLLEIEKMCTHIGIIRKGQMVYQGEMALLMANTRKKVLVKISNVGLAHAICSQHGLVGMPVNEHILEVALNGEAEFNQMIYLFTASNLDIYNIEQEAGKLEDLYTTLMTQAHHDFVQ